MSWEDNVKIMKQVVADHVCFTGAGADQLRSRFLHLLHDTDTFHPMDSDKGLYGECRVHISEMFGVIEELIQEYYANVWNFAPGEWYSTVKVDFDEYEAYFDFIEKVGA